MKIFPLLAILLLSSAADAQTLTGTYTPRQWVMTVTTKPGTLEYSFSRTDTPNRGDWFGVFHAGTPDLVKDASYPTGTSWVYVASGTQEWLKDPGGQPVGVKAGKVTIKEPPPGIYDFRYYSLAPGEKFPGKLLIQDTKEIFAPVDRTIEVTTPANVAVSHSANGSDVVLSVDEKQTQGTMTAGKDAPVSINGQPK